MFYSEFPRYPKNNIFFAVLIINKEEITTVLFVYSANKLSYKL